MPALTVAEIAKLCEGVLEGDPTRLIIGANELELAGPQDLCFAMEAKVLAAAANTRAGCIVVTTEMQVDGEHTVIRAKEPRAAFAKALAVLYKEPPPSPGIHATAIIARSASVPSDCFVGPYVVIGEQSRIGAGCFIGSASQIGNDVAIGEACIIYPQVTLYDAVQIGSRVILHSGCVIGADGFGFVPSGGAYEKFPQVGTVQIEDDVEVGANCCIDRAALGVTRIGAGTKLDNLVHIAHNCSIGRHVVIAAQTGLSGGVTIGDHAVIGGQVGVGNNAKIAARAIVGSKSGILNSKQVQAGEPVWGIPARPLRQYLNGLANIGKVVDLKKEIRELERRLEALEKQS